jgi:hypothetical protein
MKSFKTFLKEFEQSWADQAIHAGIGREDGIFMDEQTDDEFEAIHKQHRALSDHYSKFSSRQLGHIHEYTKNEAAGINTHLWDDHANKTKNAKKYFGPAIRSLDSAMKVHKTPENMTVYSSSIHDPREKKGPNNVVHHPAYLSTSIDPEIAHNRDVNSVYKDDGEHHNILKIDVPAGSKGAYVAHHSNYSIEKEFILPRGTKLLHHSTDTTIRPARSPHDSAKHTHVHHMSVVE